MMTIKNGIQIMMISCLCVCRLVKKEKGDGRSVCALLLLLVMSVCVCCAMRCDAIRCDTVRCVVERSRVCVCIEKLSVFLARDTDERADPLPRAQRIEG